ncbi:type IX secretion system periplasmic lipoprotein PorW/SprE [Mongoliitalea daihaiensis]|uniref:type IX secretion system periplasmic lipoprotein PorW/SprE n=1 Tax=Mongoliitalea daihaiensis TaxID=2782006 RepID=UPI001F439BF8|nr:gliding motility protein [Mongoliitalea daihaiensis]UJP66283.1 gliding motility protein [Mongoliitalea daihaiensis]
MNHIQLRVIVFILLFASGCSSTKDTFINRTYHNTTSRYNAYFYSKLMIEELEQKIAESHNEDFSQVLPIFYPVDSALIDENKELLKDVRYFSSRAIDWHRISKWVDENYLLLGIADYYEAQFDDASNTFRYLNVNSKKKHIRHRSLIQLMRQFIDLENFDDAAYVIDFLSKESGINRENRFLLYKTLAYYYDRREDVNGKIGALDKALGYSKDRKEKSRINFILAQLYQREDLDALAYSYYQEAQKGNPPYERSFFAQLYAQQVAELNKSKDLIRVRSYFDDLYKDSKNRDLKDVILYEKAIFELKQDEVDTAKELLVRAAKEDSKNPVQKGYIYQKLAEISFDIDRDFRATKYYMDSALANFRPVDASFKQLQREKVRLDNYVLHYETILKNDSLLRVAQLSPEDQERLADEFIAKEEQRLLREAEEKAKPKSSNLFDNLLAFSGRGSGERFYFDNSVALQQGAIEFVRVWGNRNLNDNWRRNVQSFQSSSSTVTTDTVEDNDLGDQETQEESSDLLSQIPDKASLLAQIPKDEAQLETLRAGLEISYFELGKLLFFDFKEYEMSRENLEILITVYPNTIKKPEAYYILFLANKELGGNTSLYSERLNREFAYSPFTFAVNNPDALTGGAALVESSKMYRNAYELYENKAYEEARGVIRRTMELYPLTKNTDRLLLLDIMISGKIDSIDLYKYRLEIYTLQTENPELKELARNMLRVVKGEEEDLVAENQEDTTKDSEDSDADELEQAEDLDEDDSPYKESASQTHIFVLALSQERAREAKALLGDLETFHSSQFSNARLRTGNMNMSREQVIFIVSPFSNAERAAAYRDKFLEIFESGSLDPEEKQASFVISIGNFQELNKRKDLEEYRRFFRRNY